jgi:luciferase family oxidoreductase group 1
MKLSVLEQSTLSEGASAEDAINATLTLAKALDAMGYARLWLSEHHNMPVLQGSAPEVLLSAIGAHTHRLRIGSGGVMLPNHSAYHVAEIFRMLEALYPGRVDCGIGRASGGDAYSRSLLAPVSGRGVGFEEQVEQLDRFFHDECKRALAMPAVRTAPPLWLLSAGSGPQSGRLAAEKGMGLAIALFINPEADEEAVTAYRQNFVPSAEMPEPRVILAVNFVCAATPEKLAEMRKTSDYFRLMRDSGRYPRMLPSHDTLSAIDFEPRQRAYLDQISNREVVGLPHEVRHQILARAERYQADEVMLASMSYALADKIEAFQLVAEAFELPSLTLV